MKAGFHGTSWREAKQPELLSVIAVKLAINAVDVRRM